MKKRKLKFNKLILILLYYHYYLVHLKLLNNESNINFKSSGNFSEFIRGEKQVCSIRIVIIT